MVLVKEMKGMLEMMQEPMMEGKVETTAMRKMKEMIPVANTRDMVLWRSR